MADSGAHHVTRATFFRNGDRNFKGKMMVVNPRYYRNFESFLDTVTWSTRSTNAVTRICTPHGRNFVHSVDSFQNGGNYVVLGRERFKKLNYGEAKNKATTTRLPSILRNQMPSSGRYRKVYEGEKQALKRIYVYRNGDSKTPARMVLLKKRNLADMEFVLQALQESRINCDFAISKLFTLQGKQILTCDEIMHDGRYVAMERGSRFKPINYEAISNFSPRSVVNVTRFTKLPPIATRVNPEKIHHSPRKSVLPVKDKPGPPINADNKRTEKKRVEKREPKRIANPPIPAQDSIVSPFEDQDLTRESFSHVSLSVTPPPLDESPDFTLSESIGKEKAPLTENVKKTSSTGSAAISHLDNLPDKQQDLGLQLYNASGMQSEWGEMVVDSKNAVTDKPIDDVPAEEITDDEEITEKDENSREKSSSEINDERLNTSRKQSVEEVINIDNNTQPQQQEQNEDESEKEYEIKATASRLVKRILKEEEDSEPNVDHDQRLDTPSIEEKDRHETTDDVTEKKEDAVSSSQEDINSEDEVQSSQEDESENDSNREDEEEEVDEDMSDNNTGKETEDSQSNERKPQSEGEENEENEDEEEQAAKENRTNKKVELEREDPAEAKKNQLKEKQDKRRRGEKVVRKGAQVKS